MSGRLTITDLREVLVGGGDVGLAAAQVGRMEVLVLGVVVLHHHPAASAAASSSSSLGGRAVVDADLSETTVAATGRGDGRGRRVGPDLGLLRPAPRRPRGGHREAHAVTLTLKAKKSFYFSYVPSTGRLCAYNMHVGTLYIHRYKHAKPDLVNRYLPVHIGASHTGATRQGFFTLLPNFEGQESQ